MNGISDNIGRVIALLTPGEKKRLWVIIIASILATLVEVIGIGSIMPFVIVASKPTSIHENPYLNWLFVAIGFKNDTSFLILLGVAMLGMLIVSNGSQAFLHYMKVKFTSMRRHTLSQRLLSGYLKQPYIFFLNRDSYDLVKNINNEIGQMIHLTLIQFVEFLSRIIQVSLLTLFLFLVNPTSTLVIAVVVIGLYAVVYAAVKRILKKLGAERFDINTDRSRIVSEAFWGIKEVKLAGSESMILSEFSPPSKRLATIETLSTIVADTPKFALDTAAFSSIIGYVLFMLLRSGDFKDVAGSVTLFAYAGYRMIPAIQAMFRALTQLKYGAATAEKVSKEFELVAGGVDIITTAPERLPFHSNLELREILFAYPNTLVPTISELSMAIPANSLVGIAGKTGSGKTTLVDIILGLLSIQEGAILVDGIPLQKERMKNWQANLGYVPQNIYLSNDTIAANIAFGVPKKIIDMDSVVQAGRLSQLHDFVYEELNEKYETRIGERGIKLSGGQRQRIGIARALYRNPSILIMDEATSALDSHTERAVMEAIDNLQGTRTIIMIAHRLTTLRKCDVIYQLEKGKVVDSGTYSELQVRSKYFGS